MKFVNGIKREMKIQVLVPANFFQFGRHRAVQVDAEGGCQVNIFKSISDHYVPHARNNYMSCHTTNVVDSRYSSCQNNKKKTCLQ